MKLPSQCFLLFLTPTICQCRFVSHHFSVHFHTSGLSFSTQWYETPYPLVWLLTKSQWYSHTLGMNPRVIFVHHFDSKVGHMLISLPRVNIPQFPRLWRRTDSPRRSRLPTPTTLIIARYAAFMVCVSVLGSWLDGTLCDLRVWFLFFFQVWKGAFFLLFSTLVCQATGLILGFLFLFHEFSNFIFPFPGRSNAHKHAFAAVPPPCLLPRTFATKPGVWRWCVVILIRVLVKFGFSDGMRFCTGLGFVCFVAINPRVLLADVIDLGFLFHKLSNCTTCTYDNPLCIIHLTPQWIAITEPAPAASSHIHSEPKRGRTPTTASRTPHTRAQGGVETRGGEIGP